jgi:predicted TIM-barrel fold metal-dependent hydrolase
MLHALCREPKRFRGVAIPAPDITDAELEVLDHAGVVGIRLAPRSAPTIDFSLVGRVHELGWSTHILVHGADEVEAWRQEILSLPGRFVLEHTGYPPVKKGFESAEYRFLLDCLDTGRCWVKLSPRFSAERMVPFSDTLPIVQSLVQRAPERMLWGLDWPHQSHPDPKPADGDLLDLLLQWAPEESVRNRILITNPAELFFRATD